MWLLNYSINASHPVDVDAIANMCIYLYASAYTVL